MAQDSPSLHRLIVDALPLGLYFVNPEGKINVWSDGAEQLTGYLRQDVLGRLMESSIVSSLESEAPDAAASQSHLAHPSQQDFLDPELPDLPTPLTRSIGCKDGHFLAVHLREKPLRDEFGRLLGSVKIFDPAPFSAFHNRRQDKLGAFGCLDPLTGVLNHSMIEAHVKESLNLYHVYPVPFSILCYGVDDLEKFGQRYGRAAVDAAMRIVANVIENGLRPTDFLGRWMKQEFLAILPECGENDVLKVADRLRKMVPQAGVEWWGEKLHATVSIGAAVVNDSDSVSALVNRAEDALRQSSASGGNRVVVIGSSGVRAT